MKKILGLATLALAFGAGSVAYAGTTSTDGRFQVAAQTATGGPSGGPNQAAYTVPKGATGGPSGGPNQAKYKKKMKMTKMHKHH